MTFCVLLFLSQRVGRYLWVCLAAWVTFAVLAYVPVLEPERVAVRSQADRAERIARSLGRLDADGRLSLAPLAMADTVHKEEYRRLYESLEYIRRDSAAFAPFGVKLDDFAAIFPDGMRDYVKWGYDYDIVSTDDRYISVDMPANASFEVVAGYSRYYANLHYWSDDGFRYTNDTLRIWLGEKEPVMVIAGEELLKAQLEKSGFMPAESAVPTDGQALKLLDYRSERCRILFGRLEIERSDSTATLSDVTINSVWMR